MTETIQSPVLVTRTSTVARLVCIAFAVLFVAACAASEDAPRLILPKTGLLPSELAIIVNEDDPLSVRIGEYYRERRGIAQENVIRVSFAPGKPVMPLADFQRIKREVDRRTPARVQAYALTWAAPYRVECMSITSAFAFGFDKAYCSTGCAETRASPYYNTPSITPYDDFKIRPTMSLAGRDFESVKALIDRGVESDETRPPGTGYLVKTADAARSVRALIYPALQRAAQGIVELDIVEADGLRDKQDVLFYFTGAVNVPGLETLGFLPGAMADHLTSSGGRLTDSPQMSSLRWLEAGATGSYGTVVEPCSFYQKFPNPAVAIYWYTLGETLLEAYWKSVAWPGEGIFIGEPLARPYGGYTAERNGDEWIVRLRALSPGRYVVLGGEKESGPFTHPAGEFFVSARGGAALRLAQPHFAFYRIEKMR